MKTANRLILIMVVVCFFLPGTARAELSYEGSTSIAEQILPELVKAWEQKTGKKFGEIRSTDSSLGLKAVLDGKATFGGLSRFLTQEELALPLVNKPIGYDAVVVYVANENPLTDLPLEKVKDVFQGKINNWKDLGGADAGILLVLKEHLDEGGTYGQFREIALAGGQFATPSMQFPGHRENIEYVASNPLGITLGALAFDQKRAKIVSLNGAQPSRQTLSYGEYPLARPFVLVYREDPQNEDLSQFLDFVFSREGQEIVKKYIVPVMEFD